MVAGRTTVFPSGFRLLYVGARMIGQMSINMVSLKSIALRGRDQ